MAIQIGIVKEVLGSVVAVDELGNQRILNSGDQLFLGEVVRTLTSTSKAVISMDNDKDVVVLGDDSIKFDKSVTETTSFGSDSAVSANDLQKAILSGADLTQLEATAAGGAPAAGGDGGVAQLNPGIFTQGGSISNVNADIRELGTLNSASIDPLTTVGGAAPAAANVTPPAAPTILTIDGKNPVDSTNDTTPDIVVNVDSGTTPRLVDNAGNTIPSTIVDNGNGTFAITPSAPIDNVNNINVIAVDSAGNSSSATPVNPNIDTTPPAVTITEVTPVDTDTKADGEANKAKITFTSDEPNAPYVIKVGDEIIAQGTTPATPNTPIVVEIDTDKVQSNTPVKVEVTDKAGNKGSHEKPADPLNFDDTTAPEVSIDSIIPVDTDAKADGEANKAIVEGTSNEPNAPIVLKDKDGNEIVSGTTDENGKFKLEVPADKIGEDKPITAEVTDKAGNTGKDTSTPEDIKPIKFDDNTPPAAPEVVSVDGKNPSEPTNDTTPDIVVKVEDGSTPKLVDDNGVEIPATIVNNNDGTFTITPNDPITDPNNVNVVTEDKAGNVSEKTPVNVNIDTTAPDAPEVAFIGDADDNGILNTLDKDALNSAKPDAKDAFDTLSNLVLVTIPTGVTLGDKLVATIDVDGKETNYELTMKEESGVKVFVSEDGNTKFPVLPLEDGSDKEVVVIQNTDISKGEKATAKAHFVDKAGNIGAEGTDTITIDTTAPEVSIDSIIPVDTDAKADGEANKAIVEGTSNEPNAPIVLKDKDGNEIVSGTTDENGKFKLEVPADKIGEDKPITAEVTDKAGNTGKDTSTPEDIKPIKFDDNTPPAAPEVVSVDGKNPSEPTNDTTPDIVVKVEDGSTPKLVDDNGVEIPATIVNNNDGTFTITPNDPITDPNNVNVVTEDKAGNVSEKTPVNVNIDTTAPIVDVTEVTLVDTNEKADGVADKVKVTFTTDEPNALFVVKDPQGNIIFPSTEAEAELRTPSEPNTPMTIEITDPAVVALIKEGTPIKVAVADPANNVGEDVENAGALTYTDTTPPAAVETIRFVDDKGVVNNVNGDGYINGKENDFLHNEGKTKLSVEIALSTTDRPEAGDKLVIINQKDGSTLVEHILTQDEVDSAKVSISDLVPIVDGEDSYVRVKVVDKAGNEGEYKEAKVAIDLTNSITIDTLEVRDTDASSDGRADQVMVSGTTNPGAKVKIYQTNKSAETEADQVVLLGEVTADDQGNYTFTKDAENGEDFAGINITAVSTDKAGNEVNTSKNTNPSDVIKTDKTAPDAPEIVFPEDTNKNGTLNIAENGETRTETPVVVKVPENAKVGDTLSVTINGTAPVVVTITDDIKANGYQTTAHVAEQTGSISVTATITDKANNTSEAGTGTLNVDISAPVVTISEVTPQDNVGVVDGRADSVRIKGKTLDPNQEVTLKAADGTIIGTITSDNEGNFDTTITTDKVQPGTKVTAESVDPAGNTYSSTATAGSLTNLPAPDIIFTDDQGNPKDNILTNTEVNQNSKTNAQIILPEGVKVGDVLNIKFDTTRGNETLNWNDAKNQSITLTENDVNSKVVTINTISTSHNVDVAIKASIDRGETKGAEANKSIHSDFSINAPEVSFKFAGDDNILNANEEKQDSADNQTTILVKIPDNAIAGDTLKVIVKGNEAISIDVGDRAGQTIELKVPVNEQGALDVKAFVKGYKGETGAESTPAIIYVDTVAPEISEVAITQIDTSNPRDNSADKSKVVFKVNDPSITAENIAVKNAADLPADSIRPVPNEPGKFEATFNTPLVAGSKITITATDPAGNVGTTDDSTNGIVVPDGVSVHEFREKPETPTISFVNDVNNDGNLNIAEEAKDQSGKTTLEIGIPSGLSSTDRVMVEVTKNDGQPQTLQYTLNGRESQNSFRVTDVNVANGDRISVKAYIINNQGARSDYSAVDSINVDLSAPSATITLNNISGDNVIGKNEVNGSVNVSGSVGGDVKAGDVVTITLPNGEKVTTQVLDNKTFSVDVAGSKFNGSNGVTAEVKTIDAAGNESPVASTSKSVSIDTTAPNPPSVSFVDQGNDNVLNKAENLKDGDAETTKVVVRANNPQEGDVLVITYTNPKTGEQESQEAPVGSNGQAEFSVPVVHGTPVAVEAVTKDVNGNASESANASMNVDLKAGIYLETIGYVQQTTNVAGRPSGKRQIKFKVDDIEDDRPVKVEFIGQGGLNSIPGYKTGSHHVVNAKVINGEVVLDYIAGGYGVTYGRGHTNPNLNNFTIKVSTSDNAGNTDSKTYVVKNGMLQNPDVKTPKITEVSDDVYGGKVGALNKGDKTNDSTPTIKGEAVAGKVVEIYDGNTLLGTTTANAQGKFEFVPGLLPDGRHNFTAKVVDGSLKSASSTAFNVNVDTKAGISINAAASTKEGANFVKTISGSVTDVEDGQVVTIFDAANNKTITAVVQGGKYSAKINYGTTEPEAGDIVASVTDVAGNFVSVDVTTTASQANVATTATNVTYQDYNGSSEAGFKGQLWANTLPGATDELRDSQDRPVSTGRGEMTGRGIETLGEKYSKNYQADIEFNQNAVKFDNPRGLTGFSGVVESTKAIDSDGNILVRPTATEPTFGGSKVLGNIMGGVSRGGKAGRQTDKDYVDQNGKKLTEGSFGEFVKYTGNVYVKGGTNELFVSAPAGGTNVRIVINGTEVLNYSNGASTNQAFPIRNLDMTKEGFYKVEVMMSMKHAAYKELHKAGDFSVGLVGKNGHFVAFGDTGHGIETKAFTNMDIPQDAIYQDGKIKIPTTTEVSSEESIKVTSAENDTSNKVEFVGTNNNDTIKTTEKPDFIDGKGGADTIIAGAGDDRIVFDVNDVKVDGGTGVDTLVIKADETILSSKPAVVVNYADYTPTGEAGFKGEFWAVQLNGSTTMTKDQNNMTTHSPGQSTGTGIKAQGELFSEHNQTPEVLFNQNSVRFDNLNGLTGLSGVVESIKQLDSDRHVATPFGSQAPTVGGSAGLAQALGGNRQTSVEYLDRNGKPVKAGQMGEFVKYTGNVYVKGGTNEIFVQAPAGGTHINVRINGQEVLGYNSNSSVSNTFRIDTSKTGIDLTKDGFYKVEVSMSMQNKAYENLHGSGDFSTGIVKNGHFVAFGESGHGVETKAFTDMSIPANAIYENGKVKVPVVTEVSGEEVAIKTTETIDFSQISNLDSKVENIEQIDLTGQNTTIKLNPKDVLDMTDNSETILKILGDSGDTVQADSGKWTRSADQSGVDNGFVKYESTYEGKTIQIQIDDDIKTDF